MTKQEEEKFDKLVKSIQDAMETFSGDAISESEVLDLIEAFAANGLDIVDINSQD